MHLKSFILTGLLSIGIVGLQAQSEQLLDSIEAAYQKNYKKRISKKYLDGKYIPNDLVDACKELSRLADPQAIEKMKAAEEDVVVKKLHFGLGKWISHNWAFYEGSRYAHYLRTQGLTYPDDMIDITIRMWHRQLNDRPFDFALEVDRLVKRRKEAWEQEQKEKLIYLGPKK